METLIGDPHDGKGKVKKEDKVNTAQTLIVLEQKFKPADKALIAACIPSERN